jgi:hypothetical protein
MWLGTPYHYRKRQSNEPVQDEYPQGPLTACRILFSAHHRALACKDQAYSWAMETVPAVFPAVIHAAKNNRLKNAGATTPQSEQDAMRFVAFVTGEVSRMLERSDQS